MIFEKPNNIVQKITTIQDNTNSPNKPKNIYFIQGLSENSIKDINPVYNYSSPTLINNFTKEDSSGHFELKECSNNSSVSRNNFISNVKFKVNNNINTSALNNEEPNDIQNVNNKDSIINQSKIKSKEALKIKKRKFINKFKICHFEYQKTLKEKKHKSLNKLNHKRKYKPDDIRKKIKARFHKAIKNIINENLRKAGSKKLFTFLPQIFISSISREKNRRVLNMSFRELLQKNFVDELDEKKYKNSKVDFAKYKRNLAVLEYLDKNPEICKNSGFDIISKMKYCDLLEEYFQSDEFERAIYKLREENEDEDYIKEYIAKSKGYVKFFMEVPFKIKSDKFKTISEKPRNIDGKSIEVLINK